MKRCPIKNQEQQRIIREKEEGRQKPSTVVTAVSLKLSHHKKQIDIIPFQNSLVRQPLHSSLCQQHKGNEAHRVGVTAPPLTEAFEKSAEKEKVHNWVKAF